MRKFLLFFVIFVMNWLTSDAQTLKATCPVTKAMVTYEGKENINISFIPKSLFMLLDNNGFSEEVLKELKKLDAVNMMLFNKEQGDMGVYKDIISTFDNVFSTASFTQVKNTSEGGVNLRVFVKMEKEKPMGLVMVYDGINMLDIIELEGANGDVAKIPQMVKHITIFEKLAKKM